MSQLPKDPENVYYDILMTNSLSTNTSPPAVQFIDTRSTPLIYDTTGFQMSIIRFYLDTSTLPLQCVTIQPKQADINLSVYSITLSYTDPATSTVYSYQQYLQYIPQDKSASLPKPPTENAPYYFQDNASGYYYLYSFQFFIQLVNNTFQQALDGLNNILDNANVNPITDTIPEMTFDVTTSLASLIYDYDVYGTNETGKINVFFNQSMYQLFSSFSALTYGISAIQGKNYQLQLISASGSIIQEYVTTGAWNPISSIVFTSGSLPIIPNQLALPAIYYEGKIINNSSTANIFMVVTDLIASNNMYKPFIQYNPSAQFRYISLNPNHSVRHIDVSVFWQNTFGEYIPIRLPTGGSCTMKILFTRSP